MLGLVGLSSIKSFNVARATAAECALISLAAVSAACWRTCAPNRARPNSSVAARIR